jgi:hypothetical protein
MKWLIDLERLKIENQITDGKFEGCRMYTGIRFYSDKMVMDRKKQDSKKTIRQILIDLAIEDATAFRM